MLGGANAAGARAALPENTTLNEFNHTITLSGGPGPARTRSGVKLGQTVSFNIEPGNWNVEVKAYLGGVLRAEDTLESGVEISSGPTRVPVTMRAYAPGLYKKNASGGYTTGFDSPLAAAIPAAVDMVTEGQGDYVYLADTAEIDAQPPLQGAAGGITLTLQGYNKDDTITLSGQGSLFTVGGNAALTLDHITLQGKGYILNTAPLVTVTNGAKLVLKTGSKITGNTFTVTAPQTGGAGILVDNAELEISGGEVSYNIAKGRTVIEIFGGGIYARNSSRVVMSGGAIRNNKIEQTELNNGGSSGGGIYIRGGGNAASADYCEFVMSGGIIEGNTVTVTAIANSGAASATGGGVAVINKAHFDFSGGTIRNNHCSAQLSGTYGNSTGGGILIGGASCDMSGGVVSGNTTKHNYETGLYFAESYLFGAWAGGVYSSAAAGNPLNAYFKKTGGVIYGNEAAGTDDDGIALANKATKDTGEAGDGHALVFDTIDVPAMQKRNTSSLEDDDMDSGLAGAAGGWD